jgi:hypothetical protein
VKCQAQVERVTGHANVAGYRRGARMVLTETGSCTREAVASVGALCLCTQHVKLALDGLIDSDGAVASRGELRDVRRYPDKFPRGLYSWAHGLKPIEFPLVPPPSKLSRKP